MDSYLKWSSFTTSTNLFCVLCLPLFLLSGHYCNYFTWILHSKLYLSVIRIITACKSNRWQFLYSSDNLFHFGLCYTRSQLQQTNKNTTVYQCYSIMWSMGRPVDRAWLSLIWRLVSMVQSQAANHLDIVSCLYWRLWLPFVSQLTDNPLQGLWPHSRVGIDGDMNKETAEEGPGTGMWCKKSNEQNKFEGVAMMIAVARKDMRT